MPRCLRLNCNWELAEDDVYCGWCGAKLKNYEVRLSRERVFLGFSSDAPEVFLEIDNTGQMPVTVTIHPPTLIYLKLSLPTAKAGEEADQFPENTEAKPFEVTLEGGKKLKVPIVVDVVSPPRAFHRGYMQISADDGQPPKELCLTLVPQPRFSFNLTWPETVQKQGKKPLSAQKRSQPAMPVAASNEFTLTGSLKVEEGGLLLGGLEIVDSVGVCHLYLRNVEKGPWWLSEEGPQELPFEVVVNTAELRRRYCLEREAIDQLSLEFIPEVLEPSEFIPEEKDAQGLTRTLPCIWPPLLEAVNAHQLEMHYAFPERRYIRSATLRNMGGSDLIITQVEIEGTTPWARLLKPASVDLPLRIPPQKDRTLQIKFITENLDYDSYETKLRVISNSCAGDKAGSPTRLSEMSPPIQLREMTLPVRLTVKEPQDYQGVVAIDFGTTNSCCAIGERGSPPAIFPLETHIKGKPDQDTMPSAILYERLDKEEETEVRTFLVGSNAKYFLHLTEVDCRFNSIKRRLGERLPYYARMKVHFREMPERLWECWPQDIAADIIRQGILQVLEDQLQKRVTEVVITHPARFAYWPMEALKEAFSICGVKVTHQISEPVAAALDYMMRREPREGIYHLVVFDFGGGSTDIALLEVEEQKKGRKWVIRPKLMDLDGDPFFGGDDVTSLVAQHLISSAYEILRQKGAELPDFPPLSRLGEHYPNNWVSDTWGSVWQEAEKFKISGKELRTGIKVEIFTPGGHKVTPEEIIIRQSVIADLARGPIEERIRFIPKMLEGRDIPRPDVILLAGRSCRLPVVRELIEELLGNRYEADVVLAGQHEPAGEEIRANSSQAKRGEALEELKECVARGACRFGFLKMAKPHELGVEIEPQGELEMATSSFGTGYYSRYPGTFMFAPVIIMGSRIETWEKIEGIEGVESEILIWENLDRHNPEIDKNPRARDLATFKLAPEVLIRLNNIPPERCRTMMRLNDKHELEVRLEVYPGKAGEGECEKFDYAAAYHMSGE
jgi:hypothetical protein